MVVISCMRNIIGDRSLRARAAALFLPIGLAACGGGWQAPPDRPVATASVMRPATGMSGRVDPQGRPTKAATHEEFERDTSRMAATLASSMRRPERSAGNDPRATLRRSERSPAAGGSVDCNGDTQNLARLAGQALLDRLGQYHPDCIDSSASFFALADVNYTLFSNANMQTVATAIADRAASYTPSDTRSMRQLWSFLRAGQYVAYYSGGRLAHDAATGAAVREALQRFAQSAHLTDLSRDHANTMYDTISVAGNDESTRATFMPVVLAYLAAMIANTGPSNYGLYSAQNGVYFFLHRGLANRDAAFMAAMNAQPASLPALLKQAALYYKRSLTDDGGYYSDMAANAVGGYTSLLAYANHHQSVMAGLPDILAAYEKFSAPWTTVVTYVAYYGGDCARLSICVASVKEEAMAKAFPYRHVFDNGSVVMRTAIPQAKAIQLYQAMKQVAAQYARITGMATPLDGDANATLTMYIYGTRKEYEAFQPLLFDLATNNGGIYIEDSGSFFTYERTASESIYTLEELLRHEYVHYLNGRYLIHGSFGGPSYANDRLTWFEEASAEYFAGATQADGVAIRKSMVRQIAQDGSGRQAVADILRASYSSGFTFYRYGNLLFAYLAEARPATLARLFRTLRDNDLAGFDAEVAALAADAGAQAGFTAFIDRQIAQLGQMTEFADGVFPTGAELAIGDADTVARLLGAAIGNAACQVASDQIVRRVRCTGTLDAADAGSRLDQAIRSLVVTSVADWKTLTCSFTSAGGSAQYACETDIRPATLSPAVRFDRVARTAAVNSFSAGHCITKGDRGYMLHDRAGLSAAVLLGSVGTVSFADKVVVLGADAGAARSASEVTWLLKLHAIVLGRVPDSDGLAYWAGELRAGRSLDDIDDPGYSAGCAATR